MNVTDIRRRSFATIKPDAPLLQRGLPVVDQAQAAGDEATARVSLSTA